ncbi:formyl transferase [Gilbertella persicaria]|uniref:Methionyl-tRNA formyltransferase, mitochondrial n=1 Tax=Rhizopus stolonifer TaxID=4846 RepID=A0A367KYE0_RHIST|nr:formyl transferase [Gilbertella persicaria]KAI8047853.1 formyl transferase [Gilbertella persicaria]RCI07130.1 hypothetical protein CU098_013959 [Rhizopus stolonifer]
MFTLRYKSFIRFNSIKRTRFYSTQPLRVLFFGTDDFASTHLKALVKEKERTDSCIQALDLVCPPDRRTGRKLETWTPSETKGIAASHQLEIFHTPPHAKTLNDWQVPSNTPYDLGVVVSFGYFIPPHIIHKFKYGAVNVHPSLLPKYRGAAPIQHAILYGDKETGVTIQELDPHEFDAGRILAQHKLVLDQPPVYSSLKSTLADIGSQLLIDTLMHLHERKANAVVQDASKATRAPKVKKEWSELDFNNTSAWQVEQLHRAIGEHYPLRTIYQTHTKKAKDIMVQLLDISVASHSDSDLRGCSPGSFRWHEPSGSIHIVCSDQTVIACPTFKLQNKGTISAKDFCNGYHQEGSFGVSLGVDDLIVERNMKKRAKMHPFY